MENAGKQGGGIVTVSDMNRHLASDQLESLYLFYGPEEYLKDFYISGLQQKAIGSDRLNYFKFQDRTEPAEIQEACEAISMFGDKKFILVNRSGLLKGAAKELTFLDRLHTYDVCLVFREDEADKRSKLFKQISALGIAFECARQGEDMIYKILSKAAKSNGRMISRGAVSLMVTGIGDDLVRLMQELDKLVLLTVQGETIEEAHVRSVCALSVAAKIFDVTDAIAMKNREKAFLSLRALIEDKEPPQLILTMISRHWLQLYHVKKLTDEGISQNALSERLGLKGFIAKKLQLQAKHFTLSEIKNKIDACLSLDEAVKNGSVKDVTAIELLVMQ